MNLIIASILTILPLISMMNSSSAEFHIKKSSEFSRPGPYLWFSQLRVTLVLSVEKEQISKRHQHCCPLTRKYKTPFPVVVCSLLLFHEGLL